MIIIRFNRLWIFVFRSFKCKIIIILIQILILTQILTQIQNKIINNFKIINRKQSYLKITTTILILSILLMLVIILINQQYQHR